MKKDEIKWLVKVVIIWRLFVELIIRIAPRYIPLQDNFVGDHPLANYDAEHYISIARYGYKSLQHFYFPLYPTTIGNIASLTNKTGVHDYVNIGLMLSLVSFFIAIVGLYKLVKLIKSEQVARLTILCLLAFPTSYYFAAVYTESLFLASVVWSFYFFYSNGYYRSGLSGAIASATRSTGVILAPAFLLESLHTGYKKRMNPKKYFKYLPLLIIPMGLFLYMYYLYLTTDSWLAFNNNGLIFGEYRSPTPILLPQVYYRYIFKIIPSLSISYFPSLFTTLFEFSSAIFLTLTGLLSLKKQNISWWVYLWGGFIVPTMYLNFVSLPRYTLVLFPAFVILAGWLETRNRKLTRLYLFFSCTLLVIALSLFSRGFWVS